MNHEDKTFFVDFPDLPDIYGAIKVYAPTMREAHQAARDRWGSMCQKECRRLPAGTRIYTKDPSAKFFSSMINEARRLGIPATDMY